MARTTRSETARRSRTSAEQTEECMLTEIRSDVLQKFRRERGSREDRIREGSRPIETEECRRVQRRYQGRNIS